MSRHIEFVQDERGRYYKETLDDERKCRYLVDEVCCNPDCDLLGDFPFMGECSTCGQFTQETRGDIEKLQEGIVTWA